MVPRNERLALEVDEALLRKEGAPTAAARAVEGETLRAACWAGALPSAEPCGCWASAASATGGGGCALITAMGVAACWAGGGTVGIEVTTGFERNEESAVALRPRGVAADRSPRSESERMSSAGAWTLGAGLGADTTAAAGAGEMPRKPDVLLAGPATKAAGACGAMVGDGEAAACTSGAAAASISSSKVTARLEAAPTAAGGLAA